MSTKQGALLVLILAGPPAGGCEVSSPKTELPQRWAEEDLQRLAEEYVHGTGSSAAVFQTIRELGPRDARILHEKLLQLNGFDGIERRLFDEAFEYAQAHGKAFIDLTREDRAKVMSKVTGIPYRTLLHRYEIYGE